MDYVRVKAATKDDVALALAGGEKPEFAKAVAVVNQVLMKGGNVIDESFVNDYAIRKPLIELFRRAGWLVTFSADHDGGGTLYFE